MQNLNLSSQQESLEISCSKMRLNSNMLLAIVAACPSIESLTLNLESIEFDNNFISLPQSFGLPKLKHLTLIKLGPTVFPVF